MVMAVPSGLFFPLVFETVEVGYVVVPLLLMSIFEALKTVKVTE